jgi:N-acetylmuramoyl-L-alanine amidase
MIPIRALPLFPPIAARLALRRPVAWRRAAAILLTSLALLGGQSAAETPPPAAQAPAPPAAQVPAPQAAAGVSAIAARIDRRGATTRLIFELTGPTTASAFAATGPRIVVELPEVAFLMDASVGAAAPAQPVRLRGATAEAEDSLIRSFRFGRFAPGRSRIVIDLTRPAKAARVESVQRPEGARLEIDLVAENPWAFAAAVAQRVKAEAAEANPAPAARAPAEGEKSQLPLVVLDPGHGGVDMGAQSRHGHLEKMIVFDFAQALKAKIEARGKQRVALTREEDVFIPLNDRVRFARERGAALFLSIHADTLGAGGVRGATIYTVAARASDAESARIAEKENLADQAAGVEEVAKPEEVDDILFDLARRETRALGREFAQTLLVKWRERASLNKNPTRSAGFVVLKAHDVPSALLELGYLSSDEDLANLTSPAWRERAADGVAEAIDAYFKAHPPPSRASSQ